ncbi:unnamed protein product [Periconia digitata]|uniref:Uncharacterized protein n=1 Tax=Periconia digitata TaxID=1303443 RepID=A0A9W4U127_9PLEO|nr:unnamed protein product [Periconia digitata]
MKFSALVVLAAPLLALAAPADQHVDQPKDVAIETRDIPGCEVDAWIDDDWSKGALQRYRVKFSTKLVNPEDVCNVPYYTCMAMSNRQCWVADGIAHVDGNFAKGPGGRSSVKACLKNGKKQWAKDNGCKCVGNYCK